MINLVTFNRRPAASQTSPAPAVPSPDRSDEQTRALEQREADLVAREQDVSRRERCLLEAESVLFRKTPAESSMADVTAPATSIHRDISVLIGNLDLSVMPKSPEESRARAELVVAVSRKWGSNVFEGPAPDLAREPAVQQALRLLEQRQAPLQAAHLEREIQAKALADAVIAVGKKFGGRVLARDDE